MIDMNIVAGVTAIAVILVGWPLFYGASVRWIGPQREELIEEAERLLKSDVLSEAEKLMIFDLAEEAVSWRPMFEFAFWVLPISMFEEIFKKSVKDNLNTESDNVIKHYDEISDFMGLYIRSVVVANPLCSVVSGLWIASLSALLFLKGRLSEVSEIVTEDLAVHPRLPSVLHKANG